MPQTRKKDRNMLLLLGGAGALALLLGGSSKTSATSTSSTSTSTPPKVNKPAGGAGTGTGTGTSSTGKTQAQLDADAAADAKEIEDALRNAAEKTDGTSAPSTSSPSTKPPAASTTTTSSTSVPGKTPAPVTEPSSSRELVSSLAQRLAAEVRKRKYDYSRDLCKSFQGMATGLAVDGVYGGATFNALKFYGVKTPPSALFKPSPSAAPYKPAS